MNFNSVPQYLAASFEPLRWILYAYALSDTQNTADGLAQILGLEGVPDSAAAWAAYLKAAQALEKDSQMAGESGLLLPLAYLYERFEFSPFSRFVIELALACECLCEFAAAIAMLGGPLTVSMAIRLYASSAEEAIGLRAEWLAEARELSLIFEEAGQDYPLLIRQTARQFLLGAPRPPAGCELFIPSEELCDPIVDCGAPEVIIRQLGYRREGNLFLIAGSRGAGRKYQIKRFAKECGRAALFVPCADIREVDEYIREIGAFTRLTGCLLCVDNTSDSESAAKIAQLLRAVWPDNLFVISDSVFTTPVEGYTPVPVYIPALSLKERLDVWQSRSDKLPLKLDLYPFAEQYPFTVGQIISACEQAQAMTVREGNSEVSDTILHFACNQQLEHALGELAVRVTTGFGWDELILPPAQKSMLRHICDRARYGEKVYGEWGFEKKTARGMGVRALFTGPPGTGKTMAAQVIASELNRELYKVDLSSLVSKYIGDTEKNLNKVFEEAGKSGGVLLFDEADAVFGKRGEQKDSHDRYANMQTAFLLQRFEDYSGIVLLSTNLVSNLDPAFIRRIQVRVEFPLPDKDCREKIWHSVKRGGGAFDKDIDIEFLADNFELTGAEIKNIALSAAFLSAASGRTIGMDEIIAALLMEYAKTDKIISRSALGEYAIPNTPPLQLTQRQCIIETI